MTRRDDPPRALPAQRGADHDQAHRDDPAGRDPGSEAGRSARPDLSPQAMTDLVAAATMAPSMHNTQPWRFRLEPASQTIGLYADPARMLRLGDPDGRALHIACGAALFNLRLAAAVAGRQPGFRLLPDPGQPLLLATVRLAGRCRAQPDELELHEAIPARRTNRSPFSTGRCRRVCSPNWLGPRGWRARSCISRTIRRPSACWNWPGTPSVPCSAILPTAAPPAGQAARGIVRASRTRSWPPTTPAGPPRCATSRPPGRSAMPGLRTSRSWLCCPRTSAGRADWLRAGQALERVWLTATVRGLEVSPLTQPLETADAWLVRDPAIRRRASPDDPPVRLRAARPAHPAPVGARRSGWSGAGGAQRVRRRPYVKR